MLVLSRKLGQRFQVGPDVSITIVKVDRHSVRIGIEAPDGVKIAREELLIERATIPIPLAGRRTNAA